MTTPYNSQDEPGADPLFDTAPDAEDFAADGGSAARLDLDDDERRELPGPDVVFGDVPVADLEREEPQRGEQAKQEAGKVAEEAKQGGQQVVQTAKEELGHVTSTVGEQARNLLGETRSELSSQAGTQQQRVAEGVRALGGQLQSMAEGSQEQGVAVGLARQASERSHAVASWLESREPGDLLEDVKGYARRKPATFIAVAAGIGLLAGRLTRGLTGEESSAEGTTGSDVAGQQTEDHAYATAPVAPVMTAPGADIHTSPFIEDEIDPSMGQHDPTVPSSTGPGQR